jgi:hypothetical protein
VRKRGRKYNKSSGRIAGEEHGLSHPKAEANLEERGEAKTTRSEEDEEASSTEHNPDLSSLLPGDTFGS